MLLEEDWGECRSCGTFVGTDSAVKIVQREDDSAKSTVLCPDCARVRCGSCGAPVELSTAFVEKHRGGSWTVTCSRCEDDVLLDSVVEIRNERDPDYRKVVCGDCFEDLSIPAGYTVHRDVGPG